LNLFQKQFLLVAALLVLELVLLGTLQVLVQRAEAEAARAENTNSIIVLGDTLAKDVWDMASALIAVALTRSSFTGKRYEVLRQEVPKTVEALRQACINSPNDQAYVERISISAQHLLELFERSRSLLLHREEPGSMVRAADLAKGRFMPVLNELFVELTRFVNEHKKLQLVQKEAELRTKTQLKTMLSLGIALQLVFAILAGFYFSRSITGRIRLLADNASRLARGESLHPPAGGADEIAQLDVVFHEMARALAEAAARERAVVDAMPVGFITLDGEGNICAANPRATMLLKWTPEELTGKSFGTMVAPANSGAQNEFDFEQLKEQGLGRVTEFEFVRSDGTTFPGELSLNAVVNSGNSLFVCNLLDVSERHEIERMKEEFVSIVSHDLKTPLTSIQFSLGLVGKGIFGDLNGAGQKVIRAGQEEAVRLIKLINDLLDLARIEAGRIELECEEIELGSVVTRALQSVEGFAEERGVELSSEPFTAKVWADEDRLIQVLVNLLSNAIKYSRRGQTVSICTVDLDNLLEIRVIDCGCGISEAAQKHVFERFGRLSPSDRKEKGGTGLGLAICKLVIEAHGGEIGVQSQVNSGSIFWFRIRKQPLKTVMTTPTVGRSSPENSVA
jgi:PAS domain S-box-containing protein